MFGLKIFNSKNKFSLQTIHFLIYMLLLLVSNNFAQFPSKIKLPITYYDFHSNKSAGDFNQDIWNSPVIPGLVQDTLDSERFPIKGNKTYYSWGVNAWFRSYEIFKNNPRFDSIYTLKPTYYPDGNSKEGKVKEFTPSDSSYKDIEIKDSLEFTHIGNGVYQFSSTKFFPIDNRGFGNEQYSGTSKDHNYSFSTVLRHEFRFKKGMTFEFRGDDDVWVFINNHLALDLGAAHPPRTGSFDLDVIGNQLGLVEGKKYMMDFFLAERQYDGSNCQITTNIIGPTLDSIAIDIKPDTTIMAGDTVTGTAKIITQDGTDTSIADLPGTFTWGFTDNGLSKNLNHDSTFTVVNDSEIIFVPTEAYTTVKLWGHYDDNSAGIHIKDTVNVVVTPGLPTHLVIEGTDDSTASLRDDNPKTSITIVANATENENMWAILRDEFGNWVKPSSKNETLWDTENHTIATAEQGTDDERGQGKAVRTGNNGTVTGWSTNTTFSFSDSISIIITDIDYTEINIVIKDNGVNTSIDTITMGTNQDTTLYILGKRSDNGAWEVTNASWDNNGILLSPPAPSNVAASWNFSPDEMGNGIITARKTGSSTGTVNDTVKLVVNYGEPDHVLLYDTLGDPLANTLSPIADTIEVTAGDKKLLVAKVFDAIGNWISEYETVDSLMNNFKWELTPLTGGTATISANTGVNTEFYSEDAHNDYLVTAKLTYKTEILTENVVVSVIPSSVASIVIESDNKVDMNKAEPADTLVITSGQTYVHAYAVLRDKYDNFISFSNPAIWSTKDSNIATGVSGIKIMGEGLFYRVDSAGVTQGYVEDNSSSSRDSVVIEIKPYDYWRIKIFTVNKDVVDTSITSLTMNTNQDTTLFVGGYKTTDSTWEVISADWSASHNLYISPTAPNGSGSWSFSPYDTGRGNVQAIIDNGSSDSISVVFTPGPPVKVTIEILTKGFNQIAGKPIDAKLNIYNADNKKVQGVWIGSGKLSELLGYIPDTVKGTDGKVYIPSVIVEGDTFSLASNIDSLTFVGGKLDIKLLLYTVAQNNDLHKVKVSLNDSLFDTALVNLKAGSIENIDIVDSKGNIITADTLNLSFDDNLVIKVNGTDKFGNIIKSTNGDWVIDEIFNHNPSIINGSNLIFFDPDVTNGAIGKIVVKASDDNSIVDTLWIKIESKPAEGVSEYTRDLNGNGYIDAIDIAYDKSVSIPSGFDLSNISVMNYSPQKIFTANSLVQLASDTIRILLVEQDTSHETPESAWNPIVTLSGLAGTIDIFSDTAKDGAAPVVWSVHKKMSETSNHTSDLVTVKFSEDIYEQGGLFNTGHTPDTIFNVWRKSGGKFLVMDSILTGIPNFHATNHDTAYFYMLNGLNLNALHYLNIKDNEIVSDKAGNYPDTNNQRIRVTVEGSQGEINVGPNPIIPSLTEFNKLKGEKLKLLTFDEAYQKVLSGNGTIVTIKIIGAITEAKARLMVFDNIGNLVYSKETESNILTPEIIESLNSGQNVEELTFYWSGYSSRGKPAEPGLYKLVVYVNTNNGVSKYTKTIAVQK